MTRPARACIDLHALRHNLQRVRQSAADSRVMAIIKANAYGHGLVSTAWALQPADAFGVASPEEGIALREAGFDKRIVLLEGFFSDEDILLVSGYRLDIVVHHVSQIERLERVRLTHPIDVWLKLDTGMNRLGFAPDAAAHLVEQLAAMQQVATVRCMTHFACADDSDNPFTQQQLARFNDAVKSIPGERSLANSAAVLAWPDTHADWVRPGIMLYGASPLAGQPAESLGLKAVMTMKTRLIAVNACRKGDAVGYGGDWRCPEDMPVGVAAVGYGDGYPRHAASGTPVLVNGRKASLIGRVSMDMICLDLRGHAESAVGDEVVLWGTDLPVDTVAQHAGTISYELLCGVSERVGLEYTD